MVRLRLSTVEPHEDHRREAPCPYSDNLDRRRRAIQSDEASAPELVFTIALSGVNNFFNFPLCEPENFLMWLGAAPIGRVPFFSRSLLTTLIALSDSAPDRFIATS
jgi:hypothetical protein